MTTTRIDRRSARRQGLAYTLLFIASFGVTTWLVQPEAAAVGASPGVAPLLAATRQAPGRVAAMPGQPGLDAGHAAEPELPVAPDPTLEDLARDADAQTRDEAQALLDLQVAEPLYD